MGGDVSGKREGLKQANESMIYIIGPRRLQNETLALCLEQETSARCHVGEDLADIPASGGQRGSNQDGLVLLDCQGKDPKEFLRQQRPSWRNRVSRYLVAFFNVSDDMDLEEDCLVEGVRGLFYERDPFERFVQGVRAVLAGQLWLSREIMTRWLLEGSGVGRLRKSKSAVLTRREAEILALVAVGDTNSEIADKLSISSNTVRTHLYNIFKKINVSNRLQATLWAAKNM